MASKKKSENMNRKTGEKLSNNKWSSMKIKMIMAKAKYEIRKYVKYHRNHESEEKEMKQSK